METKTEQTFKNEKIDRKNLSAAIHNNSGSLNSLFNQTRETKCNEDLVAVLSDSYENKRARQVIEWENLGRRNFYRAA